MEENIRLFAMAASRVSRRDFLKTSALAVGAVPALARGPRGIAIVVDPADPISSSMPARWAAGELQCAFYRHVNHAERWEHVRAQSNGRVWRAAIPSEYTGTPYPLQYYFEVTSAAEATLYPGLGPQRTNQPYFVVRRG